MEKKMILRIEGMTCTGCETRIENTLKKLEGVITATASYTKSLAEVTYDQDTIELDQIIDAIEKQDYHVKGFLNEEVQNEQPLQGGVSGAEDENTYDRIAKRRSTIIRAIGIGVIVLALYLIINHTVGFNFIPQVNQSMGYGMLFLVGLLTSLHCVAMCGGINLSVCMQYKTDEKESSRMSKLKPSALYNLGRVISYTVVGGLVGAMGSVISFSGTAKGIVAVVSGVFMVIMGLNMLNLFPALRKLNPRLPKFLGTKVHKNAGKRGPLVVGLLNGLMPCGPLQAMQLYALGTGSFFAGALSMFLFSVGTVPLMFGFGAVSSLISNKFTHKMMKVSAALVMILGLLMLNRGLNLSGLGLVTASAKEAESNIARIENGVQYVTTQMESGTYSPIIVQKGIPLKWTIEAGKGDLNGCNNPVTIPQMNIQQKLKIGDNLIEFTPEKEGDMIYTCWMGMISSKIRVVSDLSEVSKEDVESIGSGSQNSLDIEIPTDKVALGEIRDGIQYASVDVTEDGFSPAVIVLKEGIPTVWTLNGVQLNDQNSQLFFPEYYAKLQLEQGENALKLTPEFDFSFVNSQGTLGGYVKVVEDINAIDLEAIKEQVRNYQPVISGSGGASCH